MPVRLARLAPASPDGRAPETTRVDLPRGRLAKGVRKRMPVRYADDLRWGRLQASRKQKARPCGPGQMRVFLGGDRQDRTADLLIANLNVLAFFDVERDARQVTNHCENKQLE